MRVWRIFCYKNSEMSIEQTKKIKNWWQLEAKKCQVLKIGLFKITNEKAKDQD